MASQNINFRMRIRQNASVKEKTLLRVVAETLKKLVHLYQVKSAEEILTSFEIQALRYKLKECLSRLMFLEPLEFGQKAEDTIWKSIFYEPIRLFKKELKNKPNSSNLKSMLFVGIKRHILGAIGYYQKLIMRLQTEYGLMGASYPELGQQMEIEEKDQNKEVSPALKTWSFSCMQHCLMYIGDLYRYEHDIKLPHSRSLAIRYYNQVLQLNPSFGQAYNQLATLDTLSYYGLNAAYYFMKAQLCTESYAQAKDNLDILFERNIKRLRSVIDRESLTKKSGMNVSRGGLKVLRVKSSIIKFLNLWYSFSASADIDTHEGRQLALMCDDVLNNLSFVLGFDRKLVSECGAVTGVRPSSLSSQTVAELLFISYGCLESMWHEGGEEGQYRERHIFDLAHTLSLNLCGHVFNQCLVRVRDEIRAADIDISVLFRRYDASVNDDESLGHDNDSLGHENQLLGHEDDPSLSQVVPDKPRRKRKTLAKRLVRARPEGTDEGSVGDDLSEDETGVSSDNDNVLWDDQWSSGSSDDGSDGGVAGATTRRGGFTDSDDDETDFESEEQIHSQDEDDHIIRAIVGAGTVFGRQQSSDKDTKRTRSKEAEKVMYGEAVLPDTQTESKRERQRATTTKEPSVTTVTHTDQPTQHQPRSALHCIYNIDLLQSLTVFTQSMHHMTPATLSSFHRVWHHAPYLWKHFAVLLNFCENLLDDLSNNTDSPCTHIAHTDPRKAVHAVLPEDHELLGSPLSLSDEDRAAVQCDNRVHLAVSRLNRVIRSGLCVASWLEGPIKVKRSGAGHLWLFSHSHTAPRTNLVSKAWTQISTTNLDPQMVNITGDKEKLMREMARLRLENDFSSVSESVEESKERARSNSGVRKGMGVSDCEAAKAVYLVPDVDVLCSRLDMVRSLVRCQQFIIVVPQAVIQRLDRRKTTDHGARQIIKYLEAEMQHNNEHIKIEAASASRSPDLACDLISEWAAIETSAVRLARQATPASVSGCDLVVTVLTDKASHLSPSFKSHYSSLRVDFQAAMDL